MPSSWHATDPPSVQIKSWKLTSYLCVLLGFLASLLQGEGKGQIYMHSDAGGEPSGFGASGASIGEGHRSCGEGELTSAPCQLQGLV